MCVGGFVILPHLVLDVLTHNLGGATSTTSLFNTASPGLFFGLPLVNPVSALLIISGSSFF